MAVINLLGTTSRVEVPFVKVTIGKYTFGVYDRKTTNRVDEHGYYRQTEVMYPNYIQSLTISKISGKVNTYTLELKYPIKENDDPNFIEKVLSSVSKTRRIMFSYGDLSLPSYVYRDEEAIITNVDTQFGITDSAITYKITAVSEALKLTAGTFNFRERLAKPSDVIKEILFNKAYGLQEIFYGMRNKTMVESSGLIPGNDKVVKLGMKTRVSILEYLSYLVASMSPLTYNSNSLLKKGVYTLTIVDDVSGKYDGPYFKITQVGEGEQSSILETYEVDIGYPSENVVMSFQIVDNKNYSIFHEFSEQLTQEQYTQRIGDDGEIEYIYAPIISSVTDDYKTSEAEKTWWTKVTSYPIQATLILKGLLRPALLMTHIKLNVYFFGKKHISSGTYIITKQLDQINFSGFRTTLSLTRVDHDKEIK